MTLERLASAIQNNVVSGLPGMTANTKFTMEQIEDSIISERQSVIKEYSLKNLIPIKDLMLSIRCLSVDCESIDRCCTIDSPDKIRHVEIPQLLNDFVGESVEFLGSTDHNIQFKVYTDQGYRNHKYKRRGGNKPYAWIDTTPNKNNFYDVFLFNIPLIEMLTITAIFKDPRQLMDISCCDQQEISNITFIDTEIERRVTEKFIRYYRQMATALTPNDQTPKP